MYSAFDFENDQSDAPVDEPVRLVTNNLDFFEYQQGNCGYGTFRLRDMPSWDGWRFWNTEDGGTTMFPKNWFT